MPRKNTPPYSTKSCYRLMTATIMMLVLSHCLLAGDIGAQQRCNTHVMIDDWEVEFDEETKTLSVVSRVYPAQDGDKILWHRVAVLPYGDGLLDEEASEFAIFDLNTSDQVASVPGSEVRFIAPVSVSFPPGATKLVKSGLAVHLNDGKGCTQIRTFEIKRDGESDFFQNRTVGRTSCAPPTCDQAPENCSSLIRNLALTKDVSGLRLTTEGVLQDIGASLQNWKLSLGESAEYLDLTWNTADRGYAESPLDIKFFYQPSREQPEMLLCASGDGAEYTYCCNELLNTTP